MGSMRWTQSKLLALLISALMMTASACGEGGAQAAGEGQSAGPEVTESVEHFQEPTEESRRWLRSTSAVMHLNFARNRFGDLGDFSVVHRLEACLENGLRTPEVYLDLALAYLTFGRFDSAIAVLERGQTEASSDAQFGEFAPIFKTYLDDARRVKTTLTKARDDLRAQGQDVNYPDERIFPTALASAPAGDAFLMLNLADAWVSAFPKSPLALRCVAEMNLGFFEFASQETIVEAPRNNVIYYRGKQTNVPAARAEQVFYRGARALGQLAALDNTNSYPTIRMIQNLVLTLTQDLKGRTSVRAEMPGLMANAIRELNQNSHLTEEEKAFVQFGRSIYSLSRPSWGNPTLGDQILEWLQDATRRDPTSQVYANALAWWRANNAKITREKLAARAREDAIAAHHAQQAFGGGTGASGLTRGAELVHGFTRAMWNHMMDEMRKESPLLGEMFDQIGCPACWGSGKYVYSGKLCDTCGGDGRADK